jgi:hypothetical protein
VVAVKLAYRSFAAGEVSRRLGARVDQTKYQTGAYTLRNMVSTLEGAATNRSGFGYVRPCHNFTSANPPRLLPFVYSDDQSYVVVLEHERLSIISLAEPQFVAASTITGVTLANPCVVTTSGAHGLTTGDLIWIDGIVGTTQLNKRFFRAVVLSGTTVELEEETGTNVNSTTYTAYGSGGTVREVYSITAPWDGADLRQIRYAQTAEVMVLVHPDYPVYKLTVSDGPVWDLSLATFGPGIVGPTGGVAVGSAGSDDVRYRVCSVDRDTLEVSYPGIGDLVSVTTVDETAPEATKAVTSVTSANPPVVTSAAHGYSAGDRIQIAMTSGALEATGYWEVYDPTANTFKLRKNGTNVNGTGWTAGVDSGTVRRVHRIEVTTATHSLSDGDEVTFYDLESPFESLNGRPFVVDVISATVFELVDQWGGTTQSDSPAAATVARTAILADSVIYPTSTDPVEITWDAVGGALEYMIFREINGVYGYVGTSGSTSFEDLGYEVDPFDTPPIQRDVFGSSTDYPAAVGLFQQRLLLGGSIGSRERIDAGRTGLLWNFTKSNPVQADDSFSWVMRSNQVQGIRHILEMSRCLVFTQSSIFTLEGDDAGALVPTAINPRKRAEHGLGDVAPIPIGNAVIYVQAFGKIVREILPGSGDDFNSKDLTVYARHLFDRHSIVSWAYAEEPSSQVWAARDDGTMLGFTYLREHEVWGWHRHDTGAGDRFIDVCSIPEGEETIVYAVVQRFGVGGGDRYYIERLASRQIAHQADGRFLDSYRYHEDENADAGDTYTLNYSAGWTLEATGTTPNWVTGVDSVDIGRIILLYGSEGERYWCTVMSITSADVAVVSVRTDIPGEEDDDGVFRGAIDSDGAPTGLFPESLPYVTAEWSQSVSTLTNLWHLEGRGVRVVGDGYAQGPFVVESGSITLASPAVQVVCGLQVVSDLVTLEPDNPNGQTWTGQMKTVSEIDVRVEETDGLRVGTSTSTLTPWAPDKRLERPVPAEGQLYTGQYRANIGGTRTATGRVHLRQSDGLPTTILGVYPNMETAR